MGIFIFFAPAIFPPCSHSARSDMEWSFVAVGEMRESLSFGMELLLLSCAGGEMPYFF